MSQDDNTNTAADEQRERDETELVLRELARAYETWDSIDHTQPLAALNYQQAADVAIVLVMNRLRDVLANRRSRCGYCWRAAGSTDEAWRALPSRDPDEAHDHAQTCEHNPLVVEVARLRADLAKSRHAVTSDRAALQRSFIDDLRAAETLLVDLGRRAVELGIPVNERVDLKVAQSHVASVREWRSRLVDDAVAAGVAP